jgi:hypothetical protein
MRAFIPAAAVATLLLAGCNGPIEFSPDTTRYLNLLSDTSVLQDDISGLAATPTVDVPVAGGATYTGNALMVIDTPGTTQLVGVAALQADFGANSISGQLDDFHGVVNGGRITAFDGALALSNGQIARVPVQRVTADVTGTLTGGPDTVVVDAALQGTFRGAPAAGDPAPPAVFLNSDAVTSVFTVNGTDEAGAMEVLGRLD